jgi:hypothetical protein
MQNKSTASEVMDRGSQAAQQTAETIGDTVVQVIDRLAGTQSDVRLTFDNLEFKAQGMNATLNGAVILDVTMAKKAEGSTSKM